MLRLTKNQMIGEVSTYFRMRDSIQVAELFDVRLSNLA